ncbi:paraplegin-like [Pecten maximus]|uniref:paraplegin-like n=1 Tax=Pecten maximus TaxID=6579 RepID=UPI001459150B|nr:paraplegin-like [Pecten maximus]
MERMCASRTLQDILRCCRRRNICVSVSRLSPVRVNGLRNISRYHTTSCTCTNKSSCGVYGKHGLRNPRKEMRNFSALFTQCLQKTDARNNFGVNIYRIQNISTSARRVNSEKGSEKEGEQDYKDGKKTSSDPDSGSSRRFAVMGLGSAIILLQVLNQYQAVTLPWLETPQELRDVLLNNEVTSIQVSKHLNVGQHSGLIATFKRNGFDKPIFYRIERGDAFVQNLSSVYKELEIDLDEQIQPIFVDTRQADIGLLLMGLLLLYSVRKGGPLNVSVKFNQGKVIQGKKNIPKQPKETMGEPKKEKTSMMDMLLGDRANAGYIRGDILSKQGNGVTFKEVAGLKEAKYEVMEFVDYLKSSDNVKKLGGKHPRGVLLLGPPGCGKTLLAKAVATEAGVPFFALAGSQFVEMFGGLGASRMRNLFKEARQQAPCIIYVDEIDAIGKKRNGSEHGSEEEHTLNQLLVELDGMGTTEGIIMIASTNRSDVLDKALLRPGRFDRQIQIDFPTVDEREEIFHVYMKKLKLMMDYKELAPRLAQLTTGMSGADIANICNEAALHAARHANDSISVGDFYFAIERIVAGAEKKRSVITQEDRKVVAYHEAGHALVGWLLKHTDALLQVSIVPRTNNALGFAQLAPQDNYLFSDQQLFDRMCMMLGGRAAENITFNHVTSGAHDDLDKVTKQAYTQIRSWGMNERVGCVSYDFSEGSPLLPYSKSLSNIMDEEVKKLVARAYMATQSLLMENKPTLDLLAKTLLEKESLTYDQVRDLIGPPPHGDKIKLEMVKILTEAKESASQSKSSDV